MLEKEYEDDPQLLAFLKRKLLIRGWAGAMNEMEKEYVRRMKPEQYAAQVLQMQKVRGSQPSQSKA